MSMLKGLENLRARMEDEAVSAEETTVDVEVRVAEEVEEATSIVEEATTVVADAEASDAAAEEIEALEHYVASIKKHGLTPQGLELMNFKGSLEAFSGRSLPAVESLDSTGRNHEAAQVALETMKETLSKAWKAVVAFFKGIWEKMKSMFGKFMSYVTRWEPAIKRAKESLKDIALDPEKVDKEKFKLLSDKEFLFLSEAAISGLAAINTLDATKSIADDYAYEHVSKAIEADELAVLGLKFDEDKNLVSVEKPTEFTEQTLKAAGYDVKLLETSIFAKVQETVAAMRGTKKAVDVFGAMCKSGIDTAESMMKSGVKPEDETRIKANVENMRKSVSTASKLAGKLMAKVAVVPRAYISACSAARACKK